MKEYFIERVGTSFNGSQYYKCEATSKQQALENFKNGDCEFVEEEFEFLDLSEPTLTDIYTKD